MDKNQSFGLLLIFLILIGWTWLTAPTAAEIEAQQRAKDSIELLQNKSLEESILPQEQAPTEEVISDSIANAQLVSNFGDVASLAKGEQKLYHLENDSIKITFSNKGGVIKGAQLKKFSKIVTNDKGVDAKIDVRLMEDPKNRFEYILPINGKTVKSSELYFSTQANGNSLTFEAKADNGSYFKQTYTLTDDYTLDYDVQFEGITSSGKDNQSIALHWDNHLDRIEQNVDFEKYYSTIYYKEKDDDGTDYCSCRDDDEEEINTKMDWVAHTHQFFNSSLISTDQGFNYADMQVVMADDESEDMKLIKTQLGIPLEAAGRPFQMKMYIGPNEYSHLAKFDNSLEQIIPFGRSIFGTINRHLIRPFFEFLAKYIGSKGIVIVVLIFIIKMLLYPLMYKMLRSQAKMQALKPTLAGLTEKYKDDAQKKQVETMKIYREYGVSPFGGCMPMVLQMPIWYALFRFFPASITFRQEPFLWAHDLSSYDVFLELPWDIPMMGAHLSLFTVLWAVTTVLYTYYNTKHMDMSANPAMKYVQYFMPIMFLAFFNNYASGLTCYMFFSNLFNIAQTVLTKKFVFDDAKIMAELEQNKVNIAKKPKKKGGFQARIEEAMKQQQEIQRRKEQQRNKKKR